MAQAICTDDAFFGARDEGHFMYFFNDAVKRIADGPINPASILAPAGRGDMLVSALAQALDRFVRDVYGREDGRWVDKTPDLAQLRTLPVIRRLFPAARYIMMLRDAVDTVRSNVANWPDIRPQLQNTAKRWVQCQMEWRNFKQTVSESEWIEVDQRIMRQSPDAYVNKFADFLDLTPDRAERIVDFLRSNPELNSPKGQPGAEYKKVVLTEQERALVQRIAEEAGLGVDEQTGLGEAGT